MKRNNRSLNLAFMLLFALAAGRAGAAEFYVSKTGNDASNGTSWASARLTIQAGINLATTNGDVVHVSNGVYTITASLTITNGITVRGIEHHGVGRKHCECKRVQNHGPRKYARRTDDHERQH